ncbi:MAG: hypothetical protein QNK23_09305 [Crocinitomicaceae bacterium]|nr:hypothetical protein [Crocinitomicaceae bacterium]
MRILISLVIALVVLSACQKEQVPNPNVLSDYVEINSDLALDDLIACAGGNNTTFMGSSEYPVAVFFYPEATACEFMYFETENLEPLKEDYSVYTKKDLALTPMFNGTMMKFDHPAVDVEKWGIVTYKTGDKLHICNPIRLKPLSAPTQDISSITVITENGVTPSFDWTAENEPNNVIYFSIVSDMSNNLISGTYTNDKFWTFYDLSNVVLNVSTGSPSLTPNDSYNYTMMGVSLDNWVHTMAEKTFVAQ